MIMLIVVSLMLVGSGIGMICFPNMTSRTERFGTSVRGLEPQQGKAYGAGRVFRGLGLILAGVALMSLPRLLW